MLNLSEMANHSPNYSFLNKIQNLRNPDIYLAENISDFQQNKNSLQFPWYKQLPIIGKNMERAYVIFKNIGIRKYVHQGHESNDWFILHDESAQEVVYWGNDSALFPTLTTFEEVEQQQNIKQHENNMDHNWVSDVFVRYIFLTNLPSIVQVHKYPFSTEEIEQISLVERIKHFFPSITPEMEPLLNY